MRAGAFWECFHRVLYILLSWIKQYNLTSYDGAVPHPCWGKAGTCSTHQTFRALKTTTLMRTIIESCVITINTGAFFITATPIEQKVQRSKHVFHRALKQCAKLSWHKFGDISNKTLLYTYALATWGFSGMCLNETSEMVNTEGVGAGKM